MSEFVLVSNSIQGTVSNVLLGVDGELRLLSDHSFGAKTGPFVINGDRVYVAVAGERPVLVTCKLVGSDLVEIARLPVANPLTYLVLAPDETALLGVSYAGGSGFVWPLTDGLPTEASARVDYRNLHCVVVDDAVHFVSLGEDLITHYLLDGEGGLTPTRNPITQLTRGVGARHLLLASGCAYLVTEYTGELVRFSRPDGLFRQEESISIVDPTADLAISRFGADPIAERLVWGADLHLSAGGEWLLASERSANTIAAVRVDVNGRFLDEAVFSSVDQQPRGFWVTESGLVLVAGEASGQVSSYRLGSDGKLRRLSTVSTGSGPNWVRSVASSAND